MSGWYTCRFSRKDQFGRSYLQITEKDYKKLDKLMTLRDTDQDLKSCLHEHEDQYYVAVRHKTNINEKVIRIKFGFQPYEFEDKDGLEVKGIRAVILDQTVDKNLDRYDDIEPFSWKNRTRIHTDFI
jgi:hypothetical protein